MEAKTWDARLAFFAVLGLLINILTISFVAGPLCCAIFRMYPFSIWFFLMLTFTTSVVFQVSFSLLNIFGLTAYVIERNSPRKPLTDFLRLGMSWLIVTAGKLLHAYEIYGMENLPKTTGALIVYHHALLPYDAAYFPAEFYIEHRRTLGGIIHTHVYKMFRGVSEVLGFFHGREKLINNLRNGHIHMVAPGGALETLFSENYELMWGSRIGFAEAAKESGVPIIPMFLVNGQQATPMSTYGLKGLFREFYDRTKIPIYVPLLSLPVKLRIFIGKPIFCEADESAEEFAKRAKAAVENLRDEHQQLPGSLVGALKERALELFTKKSERKKTE